MLGNHKVGAHQNLPGEPGPGRSPRNGTQIAACSFSSRSFTLLCPLGEVSSATAFFSRFVSAIAVLIVYVGPKGYYRGRRWVDSQTIDLDNDRRFYPEEQQ